MRFRIGRAKKQREEYIGGAVQAYALPAVLVAGLSLMLLQFSGNPPAERVHAAAQLAQVTAVGR
jgi:hypothetical protein